MIGVGKAGSLGALKAPVVYVDLILIFFYFFFRVRIRARPIFVEVESGTSKGKFSIYISKLMY